MQHSTAIRTLLITRIIIIIIIINGDLINLFNSDLKWLRDSSLEAFLL